MKYCRYNAICFYLLSYIGEYILDSGMLELTCFFREGCSFLPFYSVIIIVHVIMSRKTDPFEELLHRYKRMLFSLCSWFRHSGLDTEDLIQEATIALWSNRERLLSLGGVQQAALTWKVARNAVIDTLRRFKETEALPEYFDKADEDRSLMRELYEQIERLAEPDRSIVRLQLEGYSYEEIGRKLEMTEKNVSVRLVRAKDKLRMMMGTDGGSRNIVKKV